MAGVPSKGSLTDLTRCNSVEEEEMSKFYKACHNVKATVLLQACHVFWACIDWSLIIMVFASSYWHLFNVYSLGFNAMAVVGMLLAFLVVPSFYFIPFFQRFFLTLQGLFVARLLSLLMITCAMQIDGTVRTIFLSFAAAFVFVRLFASPSTEYAYWPHIQSTNYAIGFFLMVALRTLCWSLHPFDLADNVAIPMISLLVGAATAIIIFEKSRKLPQEKPMQCHEFLGIPIHRSTRRAATVVIGIAGTVLTAGSMFLFSYMASSDALIPRWAGLDPVQYGPPVTICLGIGAVLLLLLAVFGHRMHAFIDLALRSLVLIVFIIGVSIFMTVRSHETSPPDCALRGVGSLGSPFPYIGGILAVLSLPAILEMGFVMMRHYFSHTFRVWGKWGLWILFGLFTIFSFVFHLSWFAGPMVPLFGSAFWSKELGVIMFSFIPIVAAYIIGLVFRFKAHREQQKSQTHELETTTDDVEKSTPDDSKPLNDELAWSNPKHPHAHLTSSLFTILAIFVVVFMPAIRIRGYFYSQRGSRLTSEDFTIISHNIQMGLTLYDNSTSGFPQVNRMNEFDALLQPNLWALQESDATNLLHMNRDFVSYYADKNHFHALAGAPSWVSTPGVSFLSQEAIEKPEVLLLPRGGEPLNRVILTGDYPWRPSPRAQPTATIHVMVTHISAFSNDARTLQLEAIRSLLLLLPSTTPLVLVGDFNAPPGDVEPILFRGLPGLERVKLDAKWPSETAGNKHIDHIYYRGLCPKKMGIAATVGMSDHYPVWAKFGAPTNGTCLI